MVFQADIRCPPVRCQFNSNFIHELLESYHMLDDDIPDLVVYNYTLELENAYTLAFGKGINLWDWFMDNYNAMDSYSEIEKYIVEEICDSPPEYS